MLTRCAKFPVGRSISHVSSGPERLTEWLQMHVCMGESSGIVHSTNATAYAPVIAVMQAHQDSASFLQIPIACNT